MIFSSSEKAGSNQCKEVGQSQDAEKNKEIDETPESPDTRSSSPDCQILPIIIPTERTELEQNRNRRQKQRLKVIPVITLTDSTKGTSSPTDSNSDDVTFEWDMLEESERHSSRNRGNRQPPLVATSHDVATAAKLVSNSLPQKTSDSRNYTLNSQDIPTVPVPSLGGSRRLSSILEKNRLNLDIIAANSSRSESPVNVPEVRLNSPDPEILFAKPKATSPRPKDNTLKPSSKPPSIPLLFSPLPLSQPPLSMEDLAELLNDEGDGEKNDKADENAAKQTDKTSKNFSLSEKEKLTARKNLPNTVVSPVKSSEKGPSHQSNDSQRSAPQASFLSSKYQEPRYADNYERHPRQRDAHAHESAKDKSIASPEEVPSQTPIIHNAASKPDERNVPLYQRRPNVPPEGRKDLHPRPENEFIIDNSDYYNMHANQMHWTSPTATNDHQFGNTQWTSSPYGGMTNPPLQPTQHSFPRPSMEPQFRQNQFPPTGLPAGPRPLINPTVRPQEMSHATRPDNIREDVPPGFPPQYRGFQMGQGSYDPTFSVGRPPEYPHVRPTWEGPANRMGETTYENVIPGIQVLENPTGTSYPRPNTPCPWGTRDRGVPNRNQGRDGYYDRNKNRTEVRSNFNRDGRRPDWSRDGHSDRENPNRFPNRDPRVRTEHNAVASQAKETSASARDPRLAKDKHVTVSTKPKETVHNERDPRKRSVTPNTKTTKEKPKSQKSQEKEKIDKLPKDRMQSPLESLYGVIDTKANQNSGLQKFKIPKIKRPEVPQSNRVANETKKVESVSSKPVRAKSSSKKNNKLHSKSKSKDVASAEVSSTSDGNHATENLVQQSDVAKEGKSLSSSLEKSDKNVAKIGEADSMTNNFTSSDVARKSKKGESEADGSKSKEVTQELIEALIRKSFESGEGKKLVEQAKLIQKLGEALKAKKFKKIKKIIESESESSSDKDETVEAKKSQTKKKRRVIVSDSSDDECLAERLSILTTNIDVETESTVLNSSNLEEKLEASNNSKELTKDIAKENDDSLETHGEKRVQIDNKNKDVGKKGHKDDQLEDENTNIQSENERQISRLEDNDKEKKQIQDDQDKIDQSTVEKSKESTESNIECTDQNSTENSIESSDKDRTTQSVASNITDRDQEVSNDKPKAKTKRRNSLEMLQEDIREMFISEGVITATGFRMCRLSKEGQSPSIMNPSTSSASSKKDETLNSAAEKKVVESGTETNESVANNAKSRKSLRSRNSEESSKPRAKSKSDAKRTSRGVRAKKSVLCSDSEEDQPLALRTEKFLNNADNSTSNQEVDQSEESNDILRRSKRVLYKDIKESRVIVEKTDISKIDSSKVMFDSSSDESFGIDVSELAAAVESSLRPDKQSDQDSVDTVVGSRRRKKAKNAGKRNSKSRKSFPFTDDKSEDGMSFTDEESVMSDISMSSNATVKRGSSNGSARTTAREELLSNILIGLVPTEKNTSIDKGSEADFEEDAIDPLAIEPSVKKSAKKKKKKSNWQMGIVSTKKRKKRTASGVSSKTAQTSVEETNVSPETNVSANTVEADQLISGDKEPEAVETTPEKILGDTYVDANIDSLVKCEETKPFIDMDSFDIDFKDLDNFTLPEANELLRETLINDSYLSIEESKSLIKMDLDEAKDSNSADVTAASAATASKFFKEPPKIVYDELMSQVFHRIDIKHLIDYAWIGQDKYKCLLCIFVGKNIVYHYKTHHPGREVLISRLKSTDAQVAIVDTERDAASSSAADTGQMCKFCCRFCCFVTEGAADMALEAFYEHCTTHTGEYRFHCNNCTYQAVAKASMRTHYYKVCRRDKSFNESASEDIVPREDGIYGYLCCTCNYVQLKRQNVEAHVAFWHQEHVNTEILKINMSAITVEQATSNNEQSHEPASVNTEESFVIETKPQIPKFEDIVECKDVPLMDRPTVSEDNDINECILREPKVEENVEIKEEESEERPRLSQAEPEGSVSTGNLSVFVCPPELEDKEIEIQRERQKTMQEIANNIGILLKNSKPGLSIIDKLQDKMRTDAVVSPVPECNAPVNIPEAKENSSLPFVTSSESIETEELIIKEDPLSQTSNQEDRLSLTNEQSAADKSQMTNDENDKVDVKIRDPLAILDPCNDNESDGENSDNERSAPVFESDSSSEQSDSEQTDVNMILKETSSINASSSRDPMMTTIQRLAAQLQNVKPLEPMVEPMLEIKKEIKTEPMSSIPRPPDVVPISSVKSFLAKQQNVKCRKETMIPASCKNASSSKNFIRFRRLSGDMLSMPMQFLDNDEDFQECNTGR